MNPPLCYVFPFSLSYEEVVTQGQFLSRVLLAFFGFIQAAVEPILLYGSTT